MPPKGWKGKSLAFGDVRGLVSGLVHELVERAAVVAGFESVANLFAILRLADHLSLADIRFRYIDVRSSFQIVKLHRTHPTLGEFGNRFLDGAVWAFASALC